jgi:hypothetical protein
MICGVTGKVAVRDAWNNERHRSMVVESSAYKLASKSTPIAAIAGYELRENSLAKVHSPLWANHRRGEGALETTSRTKKQFKSKNRKTPVSYHALTLLAGIANSRPGQ